MSAIQECRTKLQRVKNGQYAAALVRTLERHYINKVAKDPTRDPDVSWYSLLIAAHFIGSEAKLYKSYRSTTIEVFRYECFGISDALARYLIARVYAPEVAERQILHLAAYMLASVKFHVDGCGGASQFFFLRDDGGAAEQISRTGLGSVPRTACEWLESRAAEYEEYAGKLLLKLSDPWISDSDYQTAIEHFVGLCKKLRQDLKGSGLAHEAFAYSDERPAAADYQFVEPENAFSAEGCLENGDTHD